MKGGNNRPLIEYLREIDRFNKEISTKASRITGQHVLVRHSIEGNDEFSIPRDGLRKRFISNLSEGEGISIQWDPTKFQVDKHIDLSSNEARQINLDRLE